MTISETIQAEELARWIDGDRDQLPNAECTVALWAMRPDLAPNPRVTLDDVLSRVTSGPFFEATEGVEESLEDDFVEAVFAQARHSFQSKVSLNDILTRVESGPFAKYESEGVSPTNLETDSPSANNNRWWGSPILAGGLAVALVLFILIPTQFKSTVSDDSIFATSFEMEEPVPAAEVDANVVSKQSKSFGGSAKSDVKRPKTLKQETINMPRGLDAPAKVIESDKSESLKKSMEISPASEAEEPPLQAQITETTTIVGGGMNSLDVESAPFDIEAYDLNGGKDFAGADLFSGEDIADTKEGLEEYEAEVGNIAQDERAEIEDESIEVSAESTNGTIDSVSIDSVAERSAPRSKRQKKSKGFLSKRMDSAGDRLVEPSVMGQSEEDSTSTLLPSVLTIEQQLLVRQATNAPSVFALCDTRQPTQALDILWTASRTLPTSDAITVLKQSSSYDHGDTRYLKRNLLRLSSLLFQIGQEEEGVNYQQQASSLP